MRVSDKYCPWVNADLRALIKSRDKLKLAASKNKSTLLMSSYRHLRNKVNSLNTKLKRQYFATRVSKFKGNMKESWKTINLLFNKRSKSTNIDLLRDQNKTISNKGEISQSMNSFFCSIGKDLASNIEDGHDPLIFCDYFLNSDAAKFAFKSIHAEQIREAIGKLKTSKSFGDDGISSYFLKLAMPFIEDSLVYIYSTLHSKQVNFLTLGKLPEFHQFSKMVTKPKSLIIGQYRRYLLSPGSLKNLFSASCIGI